MRCAVLLYGHEAHHLDHLSPLAAILEIPLLVTDEEMLEQAKVFYPTLTVQLIDPLRLPEYLVSHYECIFYTMPRDLFDELFFFAQKLLQKKIHTIWCPHGNSDKGHTISYMEALKKEKMALVYGKKMRAFLQLKGAFDQLKACIEIGNFRSSFYKEHSSFYDQIVKKKVLKFLPPAQKTLLYAPTWLDYEKSSSFYEATEALITHLPENWNLIIKLHPNLLAQDFLKTEKICQRYATHPNVLLLKDFPPIYPLLNQVDAYIGDYSSIGYDFLTFNRPLFFCHPSTREIPPSLTRYLFRCGPLLTHVEYETLYKTIAHVLSLQPDPFTEVRKEVYNETFGTEKTQAALKKEIFDALCLFEDEDLNFF